MVKTVLHLDTAGSVFVGSAMVSSASYGYAYCAFGKVQISSLSNCTDDAVCHYATHPVAGGKKWSEGHWQRFVQEAKRRGLTCGVKNAVKLTPLRNAVKPTPLRTAFITLTKEDRRLVQEVLKEKGLYTSKVDGLYGKRTSTALGQFNKAHFSAADLKKKENVEALLNAVLRLKNNVAAECSYTTSTSYCSAAQLCSNATQSVNGQLQWVTNSFADAAKKKGSSCNVVEIKEPVSCSSNPTVCRDNEICTLATKADSGVVQWQNNPKFRAHVDAAKTRRLECGVFEGIAAATVAFESGKYNTAFELSQVLAVQGNADAQFYLGKMYEGGLGALQISTLAHMWFNISALNGNEEAPERRKAIQQSMTPAAVEKAQTMALSCIQSRYVDCGAVMPVAPKVKTQQVQKPIRVEPTSSELRAYFVSQSLTERKQIQYALKKLGYYGSSVDGLWGKGTNRVLVNYVSNERDITLPSAIYPSLIAKVEVPSRFATLKKKVVQQKQVSTANLSRDGKKCVSNGFSPGTQEYLQCLSYEQQRRQNQSNMLLNLGQSLLQTPSMPAPSTGGLNGGVFCNTMGNYTYCN